MSPADDDGSVTIISAIAMAILVCALVVVSSAGRLLAAQRQLTLDLEQAAISAAQVSLHGEAGCFSVPSEFLCRDDSESVELSGHRYVYLWGQKLRISSRTTYGYGPREDGQSP
ncbi:MAG: hypothetical protein RL410_1604 [Actinomycetota bacterium]